MAYTPERFDMPEGLNTYPQGTGSAVSSSPQKEIRVVDEKTGGEKGAKLARFSLIASGFEWALAEHYGKGSRKYADRNWEKGYKWSLSYDALRRHIAQWLAGERYDVCKPDCLDTCTEHTGSHHLVAVGWHAAALWWFDMNDRGTNDIAPHLPPNYPRA